MGLGDDWLRSVAGVRIRPVEAPEYPHKSRDDRI